MLIKIILKFLSLEQKVILKIEKNHIDNRTNKRDTQGLRSISYQSQHCITSELYFVYKSRVKSINEWVKIITLTKN